MPDFVIKSFKPSRIGFGEGLKEAGAKYPELIGLGADITSSVSMDLFAYEFPERFYSFGIAEQNIVGVAAGMALSGKIPVFSTYGVFAAMRTLDQIRISLCYNKLHVLIGGAHAGISVGPDGATHQALEDIAVMRVLPNMTVLSPCDATQAKQAVLAAMKLNGPVYIRFGREAVADFIPDDFEFIPGKVQLLKEGKDLSVFATGHMVWEALKAAEQLMSEGIDAEVINVHTIKPIDAEGVLRSVRKTKCAVSIEEHQVHGGLGSVLAEVLAKNDPYPMEMIGMNDSFGESGSPDDLLEKYGLKDWNVIRAAKNVIKRKA